ncbi:MAG TPA: FAD-binding oxidoreductase [Gemmatimonadales bacterium]|nr:FAD-binding oxidoreductase [Gemmatimonadales bacterium]
MSTAILERLTGLLGPACVGRDPSGLPRAMPDSSDAAALVLRLAHDEGWKVRLEGRGSWLPADAPADLALSSRGLDQVVSVSPADLVATVQAGVTFDTLERRLAAAGMWLPLDPPGRPDRSVGSIIATATTGPLRAGAGTVRDHVLGCTFVTGDGKVVDAGGRVVKNVAGYDLTKLQVGGFGGFGMLTELHLRLRARPEQDVTLVAAGDRDRLTRAGRSAIEAGVTALALELCAPAVVAEREWQLAARLAGPAAGASAESVALAEATGLEWRTLAVEQAHAWWTMAARAPLGGAVTLRLGALPDGLDETLDLLDEVLDAGLVTVGTTTGQVRWSGDAHAASIKRVRAVAASREVPLTLERAPWTLRREVGHFGAYREGVGPIVGRLRDTFDPGHNFVVALEGDDA